MLFRLIRVADLENKDKTSDEVLDRIGRVFELAPGDIEVGRRLFMPCKEPGYSKSVITSRVGYVSELGACLIIKTENSYYYLIERDVWKHQHEPRLVIRVSDDEETVKEVRQKIKENDGYCPCKLVKNDATRCICKEFRDQVEPGECHCGLYIKVED